MTQSLFANPTQYYGLRSWQYTAVSKPHFARSAPCVRLLKRDEMSVFSLERRERFAASITTLAIVVVGILLYPIWLQLFQWAAAVAFSPEGALMRASAGVGVASFLLLAFSLPALGFVLARANSAQPMSSRALASRRIAHLAFAAPSLYVAAGAYRGLLQLKVQESLLWAILWLAVAAILALRIPARDRAVAAPPAPAWLSVVHGSVAAGLIVFFLGWHMANHLSALLGSDVQHDIMLLLRRWYRSAVVQPVLIAGFIFMIGSGQFLARRATVTRTDGLGTLQTLTGAYLAAFLLSHLTSTFSARVHGVNTDWLWATSAPEGLVAGYVRLIPHYVLGVACLGAHLGCGLRLVLLQHRLPEPIADRIAWSIIGAGALLASAIMAGMLGLRL